MTEEIEQTRDRILSAAKRLGLVDVEIAMLQTRANAEISTIDVAFRLGMLQAKYDPIIEARKRRDKER